jgi:hypothetical protein
MSYVDLAGSLSLPFPPPVIVWPFLSSLSSAGIWSDTDFPLVFSILFCCYIVHGISGLVLLSVVSTHKLCIHVRYGLYNLIARKQIDCAVE